MLSSSNTRDILKFTHSIPKQFNIRQSLMVFTLPGMMVRCTVPSFLSPPSDIWPPPPLFHPAPSPPTGRHSLQKHNNRLQEYRYSGNKEALRYDLPISAPLHPHPERKDIFISSSLFRLFSSSFCCRSRCTLSARRPASFLRPSTTEANPLRPP